MEWWIEKSLPPGGRGTAVAVVGECETKGDRLFGTSETGKVAHAPPPASQEPPLGGSLGARTERAAIRACAIRSVFWLARLKYGQ